MNKSFQRAKRFTAVTYAKCTNKEHYWKKDKWSNECKNCKYRTSLRKGTIIEFSKLSFLVWYKTMFLMSATKKGFSAKELRSIS